MHRTSSIWFLALSALCILAKDDRINQNYRLRNETYPEHYIIKLTTHVQAGEKALQGEVIINIKVANDLFARQLEIFKVAVANPYTGESEQLLHYYGIEHEFLTLKRKLNKQFAVATKWKLSIIYGHKLRE